MSYRFSLEKVLSYHQSQEETAQDELARKKASLEKYREKLTSLTGEYNRLEDSYRELSRHTVDLPRLCSTYEYMSLLKQHLEVQEEARIQAELQVQKQRDKLVECWQQRKILELLQEKDYTFYIEQKKQEERAVEDEYSLANFIRNKDKLLINLTQEKGGERNYYRGS